jgi:hypothetical protein
MTIVLINTCSKIILKECNWPLQSDTPHFEHHKNLSKVSPRLDFGVQVPRNHLETMAIEYRKLQQRTN